METHLRRVPQFFQLEILPKSATLKGSSLTAFLLMLNPQNKPHLFADLNQQDRERALYNLDRYFEIVLGIFLRREREREKKKSAFDEPPRAS
jgi:hypothetical protein